MSIKEQDQIATKLVKIGLELRDLDPFSIRFDSTINDLMLIAKKLHEIQFIAAGQAIAKANKKGN